MARPPSNATRWKERAEIDYLGPFVKAWAGFNSWFKVESGSRHDKDGLAHVKGVANHVRARILPLLAPIERDERGDVRAEAIEATRFKLLIASLHSKLEAYALEVHKNDRLERISFRSVCLSPGGNLPPRHQYNRHHYLVTKPAKDQWQLTVSRSADDSIVQQFILAEHSIDALTVHASYIALSPAQRSQLLNLFQQCDPRPMIDLLNGTANPIAVGDALFRCTPAQLFGGLVEIIYSMRNALLHGEIQPAPDVLELYEPAYRIVMQFLDCVRD